jgi:hypothetical protein
MEAAITLSNKGSSQRNGRVRQPTSLVHINKLSMVERWRPEMTLLRIAVLLIAAVSLLMIGYVLLVKSSESIISGRRR